MLYTTEIVIALSYQSIEKYFMVKMTIKLKKNNMTVCAWHIKSLIVAPLLLLKINFKKLENKKSHTMNSLADWHRKYDIRC